MVLPSLFYVLFFGGAFSTDGGVWALAVAALGGGVYTVAVKMPALTAF